MAVWTFQVAVDFWRHPKAIHAGRDGRDLHLAALAWSSGALTDGFIPDDAIPALAAQIPCNKTMTTRAIARLISVAPGQQHALWERVTNGFQIHDFLQWQVPASKRKAQMAAQAERQQRYIRKARRHPDDASDDGGDDASSDASVTPTESESESESELGTSPSSVKPCLGRPVEDDDGPSSIATQAIAILAQRALDKRRQDLPDQPIRHPRAWTRKTTDELWADQGDQIERLANGGLEPEQIADRIEGRPAAPEATIVRLPPRIHCPWCNQPHPLGHCPHEPNA